MAENNEVASNVLAFLDRAAALHAKSEEQKFSQSRYCDLLEMGMQSPIEQMFWVACHAQVIANHYEVNPDPIDIGPGQWGEGYGVHIQSQARIGNYRVDFLLTQRGIGPKGYQPVVVELDGHAFHDKDKRQRSYEKARDRFLVKSGYRVLHFTGSDVVKDPFAVSYEALELLGLFMGSSEDAYNPKNPLGVEL